MSKSKIARAVAKTLRAHGGRVRGYDDGGVAEEPEDHGLSERQKLSPLGKALSPVTGYWDTYQRMNREARDTMSGGVSDIARHGSLTDRKGTGISDVITGAGKVGLGALDYTLSPINAAYRSVVGQPIEDVTGIPREQTELTAQLATPGLGFARMPGRKPAIISPPKEPLHERPAIQAEAPAVREAPVDVAGGLGGAPGGDESLRAAQLQAQRWAGERAPLEGLPVKPQIVDGDFLIPGPVAKAHDVAEAYMQGRDFGVPHPDRYHPINVEHAKRIAQAFEDMPHAPKDPEVRASYEALAQETLDQYRAIREHGGLKVTPVNGADYPYHGNPRAVVKDVADNNHMAFFKTNEGFGTNFHADPDHVLLRSSGEKVGDHDMLYNDLFRVVHDYFGHVKNGNGFRGAGEDNAWRAHAAMYSPLARRAMTTETRGQNSWLNYGPHGDFNRTANAADTIYADQKIGLMPEWTMYDADYVPPQRAAGGRVGYDEGGDVELPDVGEPPINKVGRYISDSIMPSAEAGPLSNVVRAAQKAKVATEAAPAISEPVRAYHGSPHDFDRFDMGRIGSGEGQQVYGHGLYFTDREPIAKHYRDQLQRTVSPHLTLDGDRITSAMIKQMATSADPAESYIARNHPEVLLSRGKAAYDKLYQLRDNALWDVKEWARRKASHEANPPVVSTYKPLDYEVFGHTAQNKADMIGQMIARIEAKKGGPSGKVYEVDINADPSHMIDWDRKFKDQSPFVQERTGDQMQKSVVDQRAAIERALSKERLHEAGVDVYSRLSQALGVNRRTEMEERLAKLDVDSLTGQQIYKRLGIAKDNHSQDRAFRAATAEARDLGIPALKYYDGNSRGDFQRIQTLMDRIAREKTAGQPHDHWDRELAELQRQPLNRNYVTFDDKLIDIRKKYEEGGEVDSEGMAPENYEQMGGIGRALLNAIVPSAQAASLSSVLKGTAARAKGVHLPPPPPPEAPAALMPQLAERYPEIAPPVPKVDKVTGRPYMGKDLSDEALELKKHRLEMKPDIEAGNYEPHFDPAKRTDVDPANYATHTDTGQLLMKKPVTRQQYDLMAGNPEAVKRLDDAYARGLQQKDASGNWYFMKQLEDEFVKEYGATKGRELFKERFADAMAATTGGADPTGNLLMAHYGNYLKAKGRPVPPSNELPYPVGGQYAARNMDQFRKMVMEGEGIDELNPKRYNFSGNFLGQKARATIDEQMSKLFKPGMQKPPDGSYGHFENVLAARAAHHGVDPRYFQEVAWAGAKDAAEKGGYAAKPMISHVNDAIERTRRITGLSPSEIVRRALVRSEMPLYGGAAAVAAPALMPQQDDGMARGGRRYADGGPTAKFVPLPMPEYNVPLPNVAVENRGPGRPRVTGSIGNDDVGVSVGYQRRDSVSPAEWSAMVNYRKSFAEGGTALPPAPWATKKDEEPALLPPAPWATAPKDDATPSPPISGPNGAVEIAPKPAPTPQGPAWLETVKGAARGPLNFIGDMGEAVMGPFGPSKHAANLYSTITGGPRPTPDAPYGTQLHKAAGVDSAKPGYGGSIAETVTNPASYIGPGGPVAKGIIAAASGAGGEFGEEATGSPLGRVGGALAAGPLAARMIKPQLAPAQQTLADARVTQTPGQLAGGFLKNIEDKATSIPILGHFISNARTRSVEGFNRSVGNQALEPIGGQIPRGTPAGHQMVAQVEHQLGDAYDRVVPYLQFAPDRQFATEMLGIHQRNQGLLPPAQLEQFNRIMSSSFGRGGNMTGQKIKTIEEELGKIGRNYSSSPMPAERDLGYAVTDTLRALRGNLERVNPQYADELQRINAGWAMYVRMRDAAGRRVSSEGVFMPSDLLAAVKRGDRSAGKGSFARGDALMQDFAEAGQHVLPSKVPDSGTAGRALAAAGASALGGGHLAGYVPAKLMAAIGAASAAYTRPSTWLLNQYARPRTGVRADYSAAGRGAGTVAAPLATNPFGDTINPYAP